jgi:AraC family cel operon transcriptional repressor
MLTHLHAHNLIDPEMEAHYSLLTMHLAATPDAHITTLHHDHDFYELFLVINGRLTHLINGEEKQLQSGDLVFIRPADQHSYRQIDGEDCGLINLAFPVHTITALFAYLGNGFQPDRLLTPARPPCVHLCEIKKQAVMTRLAQLNSIPHTQKSRIRTHLRLILAELLGDYFAEEAGRETAVSPPWLHDLCQQMQDPANLRGGVAQMQTLAHTSPEHLSRTVRKELGCTPTQYINHLRLTYAANLLLHSDRPILDICAEIGFDNLSYFYRLFKQRYHATPAHFRAQHQSHRAIP